MCGIAGIYDTGGKEFSPLILEKMVKSLVHRGPDDLGVVVASLDTARQQSVRIKENEYGVEPIEFTNLGLSALNKQSLLRYNLGFGHTRLAIIDLSRNAHQPMCSTDRYVWIVYNGEIYNYRELRTELQTYGSIFKSNSDTEVIVAAYQQWGIECLTRLNGIFTFALWDGRKSRLILARDRFGVKPLYYYKDGDRFVFASELKAFLNIPGLVLSEHAEKIPELLTFRYIAGEDTCFKQIKELMPGHFIIKNQDTFKSVRYWRPDQSCKLLKVSSIESLENALMDRINEAVKRQLISDVPVGTLLSGGVDSSLVTSIARRFYGERLIAFSVGFHEEKYDEVPYATIVADHINVNLKKMYISGEQFADQFLKSMWYLDEPITHPNSIQTYLILKYAKEQCGVKVILSGEGADELFGGYGRYLKNARMRIWWKRLALSCGFKIFPQKILKRYEGQIIMSEVYYPILKNEILKSPNNLLGERRRMFLEIKSPDIVAHHLIYDQNTYLIPILQRMDRMGMASGLEARVPYLDNDLVDFVCRIPSTYKVRHDETKYIFKKVSRNYIPEEIVTREKMGFGIPIDEWLRDRKGLGRYMDVLFENKTYERGYFKKNIKQLAQRHLNNEENYGNLLWNVLNHELWYRMFIERSIQI